MKFLILLLALFALNSQAMVFGGYDHSRDCNFLSVHWTDGETGAITPALIEGSKQLGYTTIFGNHRDYGSLATKNLKIDFRNRRAVVNAELTVALGANKVIPKRLFLSARNKNFNRFINTVNVKTINLAKDSLQYICYRSNGEIVDLKFSFDE